MGIKSRTNFKVNGCFPNENKCKKCIFNDECQQRWLPMNEWVCCICGKSADYASGKEFFCDTHWMV